MKSIVVQPGLRGSVAVVGGNEVTNPFTVTEVFVQKDGKWLLAQLSFSRLLGN